MDKIRCPSCGRTLLLLEYGKLEIKCPRCGEITEIEQKRGNEQRERESS